MSDAAWRGGAGPWGEESWSWNADGDGLPGISLVGDAIQVWALFQDRQVTVMEAALAFNLAPRRIVEAVREHHWMILVGDDAAPASCLIAHEGE